MDCKFVGKICLELYKVCANFSIYRESFAKTSQNEVICHRDGNLFCNRALPGW